MTDREQWRAQTGCVHPKSAFPRAGPAEDEIGSALGRLPKPPSASLVRA